MTGPRIETTDYAKWKAAQSGSGSDYEKWRAAHSAAPASTSQPTSKEDQPETRGERAAGVLSAGYQGLTLGAGNKITAGIHTILPEVLGGSKGWDYGKNLETMTDVLQQYRQRHPLEATAVEMGGSLPTILATGGAGELAGEATAAQKAFALAKMGAKYGGVTGVLSANKLSDVPGGAFWGTVTGATATPLLGVPLGAATRGVAGLARWGASKMPSAALQKVAGAIADKAGVATSGTEPEADLAVRGALQRGGVDLSATRQVPPNTTALDLGSRPMLSLARAARNVPESRAGQTLDEFLSTRSVGSGKRVKDALTQTAQIAPESFEQALDDQLKAIQQAAEPLYTKAMEHPGLGPSAQASPNSPSLGELFKRPSLRKALDYGNQIAAERGEAPIDISGKSGTPFPATFWRSPEQKTKFFADNPQFKSAGDPNISMQSLHDLKLRMDELVGYAKNRGQLPDGTPATKQMLREYGNTQQQLLAIIDKSNPAYAKARGVYAGDARLRGAFEAGRDFFSTHSNTAAEGAREIAHLSPSEQELWRRGGMTWLQEQTSKLAANPDLPDAARGVNIGQRLFGSEHAGDRAKLLFGTPERYQAFLERMKPEATYPQAKNFLMAQSSTAGQEAEKGMQMPSAWAVGDLVHSLSGSPTAITRTASRLAHTLGARSTGMTPDMAEAIASRATQSGEGLQAMLKRLSALKSPSAQRQALRSILGSTATVPATDYSTP